MLTIGLEPITLWEQILSLSCLPVSPSEHYQQVAFVACGTLPTSNLLVVRPCCALRCAYFVNKKYAQRRAQQGRTYCFSRKVASNTLRDRDRDPLHGHGHGHGSRNKCHRQAALHLVKSFKQHLLHLQLLLQWFVLITRRCPLLWPDLNSRQATCCLCYLWLQPRLRVIVFFAVRPCLCCLTCKFIILRVYL